VTLTTPAPPASTTGGAVPPRLAEGVDLIGEYEGSGFKEPPSLVRRSDGQVIQLTPLLYAVAEHADGQTDYGELARRVGADIGRNLSADNVRFLVDERLRPLGVVTRSDGSEPPVTKADPLLGLKFRAGVIPERVSNVLGALFRPLFFPPVVLAVLAGLVAVDTWLFAGHGVAQAVRQSVYHPAMFLVLFAAVVASAAFHEIGHATACRYGGAKPGKMGCGLYLAWPAFFTDVTDAYRLGRRARLRTDLGGVYFNVVVILVTMAAYFATGFEPLLLLVVIQHFEIVHQLLPIVRLDGYYIVADFTGVPDLFTRIKPILTSLLPWKRADDKVRVLKPWVRVAVTAWVLVVVPLLLVQLLIVLVHLPRILGTAWDSGTKQAHTISTAFGRGDVLGGITGVIEIVVLTLPIVGILLMLVRVFQRVVQWTWARTDGRPVLRGAAALAGAGCAVLLAMSWLPAHNYDPIGPGERGTLAEGVAAVRELPTGHGPLVSERRASASASSGRTPASTTASTTSTTATTTSVSTTSTTSAARTTATSTVRSTTSTSARPTTTSTTTASTTTSTTAPTTTTTTAAP
jgi:putative peptide zinc metalloprotease protein